MLDNVTAIATPDNAKRTPENCTPVLYNASSSAPAAPPRHATNGSADTGKCGRPIIAMVSASPAPWVTPRISGEASGLRITPCTMAPARPNAQPVMIAIKPRGRR